MAKSQEKEHEKNTNLKFAFLDKPIDELMDELAIDFEKKQ